MMKETLKFVGCIIGVVFFTLAGLWSGTMAKISDSPAETFTLAIVSAISISIAIVFAGYGTYLCKKDEE